jgi:hypothetical protein
MTQMNGTIGIRQRAGDEDLTGVVWFGHGGFGSLWQATCVR